MDPAQLLHRFEELPFAVEVEVGQLVMTIGEIFELQEGAVLRTNHPAGEPFTLRAGGVDLATADIIVVDGVMSARINKMTEKPKTQASVDGNN